MSPGYSGLTLTVTPTVIELGSPITFYGRFVWYEEGVANTKVSITENGVYITEVYTDSSGYYTKQWTPRNSGSMSYQTSAVDPPPPPPPEPPPDYDPDEPDDPPPPPREDDSRTTPGDSETMMLGRFRPKNLLQRQRSKFFGAVSQVVGVQINSPDEPEPPPDPEPEGRIRLIDLIRERLEGFRNGNS